jgi:hypothetical protein
VTTSPPGWPPSNSCQWTKPSATSRWLREAQIGSDLSVKRRNGIFSWPSHGATARYSADEPTIEASDSVISDFMTDFAEKRRHCGSHRRAQHGQS